MPPIPRRYLFSSSTVYPDNQSFPRKAILEAMVHLENKAFVTHQPFFLSAAAASSETPLSWSRFKEGRHQRANQVPLILVAAASHCTAVVCFNVGTLQYTVSLKRDGELLLVIWLGSNWVGGREGNGGASDNLLPSLSTAERVELVEILASRRSEIRPNRSFHRTRRPLLGVSRDAVHRTESADYLRIASALSVGFIFRPTRLAVTLVTSAPNISTRAEK